MGSQVNRLWLPAAVSMGMATHAVSMDTDSTHRRSMTGPQRRRKESTRGRLVRKRGWSLLASGSVTRKGGITGLKDSQVVSSSSDHTGTVRVEQCNPTQPLVEAGCIHHRGSSVTRPPSPERCCGPIRLCSVTGWAHTPPSLVLLDSDAS